MRKIILNISPRVHEELKQLARAGRISSVSEFIRRGIALLRFKTEMEHQGGTFFVADQDGKILREVVFLG